MTPKYIIKGIEMMAKSNIVKIKRQTAVFTLNKLRLILFARGITQEELGAMADLSSGAVNKVIKRLETGDIDQFEYHLNQLVHKKFGKYLRITRVIRIYDQNVIYLVKPKQVRYWLRSVAVRDADETFEDLVKQGY